MAKASTSTPSSLPQVSFLRLEKNGSVIVDLHVSPNAAQTRITGLHDGALSVRLKAVPVDGKANAALLAWLASILGIPRGGIELVRGQSAKRKQFRISAEQATQANWSALLPQTPGI